MFEKEKNNIIKGVSLEVANNLEKLKCEKINEYGYNLSNKEDKNIDFDKFLSRPQTFVNKDFIQGKR